MRQSSTSSRGTAAGHRPFHPSIPGLLCAAAVFVASACDGAPAPAKAPSVLGPRAAAALTATPGTPAHALYAERGFTCADCHPCGTRSPDGHASAWMDQAAPGFHATSANQGLAGCTSCHGPDLDGVGGSTGVSCAQCHGAGWRTSCTMCHGGVDGTSGAPPKATWGNGGDAVRVGAHTAHVAATHAVAQPVGCGLCHTVPTDALSPGHADAATATVTFTGLAAQGTHPPATWDRGQATCANTYCHGATLAGGQLKTPVWTAADGSYRACGACHGAPPPSPHSGSTECGSCHAGYTGATVNAALHMDGKLDVNAMSCTSCHGSGADPAPPLGTHGETLTTARAVGAHQAHLDGGALAGPIACGECHVVPAVTAHADGTVQLAFGPLASAGGATPSFDPTTLTCASYCHGQTLSAGGSNTSPLWTRVDGTQAACGTCHGAPPPPPHSASTDCGTCHAGYTQTSVALATHVNGTVEAASPHAAGWSDPAQHGTQVNLTGLTACASCHALTDPTSGCTACHASAGYTTWDTTCTFCHGDPATGRANPPVDIRGGSAATNVSVGVHAAHVTTSIATAVACGECHPARAGSVTADAQHVDGNGLAEVAFGALARTGGAAATYTRVSATSATCASTYCHGRFSGGANSGRGATVSWTSTAQVTCSSCHGNPPSTGEHSKHLSERLTCSNCHNAVVSSSGAITGPALHVNGSDNVNLGGTWSGRTVTGSFNPSTRTCSGLACHGSETW